MRILVLLLLCGNTWAACHGIEIDSTKHNLQLQLDRHLIDMNAKVEVLSLSGDCTRLSLYKSFSIIEPWPTQLFGKTRLHLNAGNNKLWVIAELKLYKKIFIYAGDILKDAIFDRSYLQTNWLVAMHVKLDSDSWSSLASFKARRFLHQGGRASVSDWIDNKDYAKGHKVDVFLIDKGIKLQLQGSLIADGKPGQEVSVRVDNQSKILKGKLNGDGKVYLVY